MRQSGQTAARICATNTRYMYWTFAQILTHHTSNGCNLRPGDLIASGTVSGPTDDACACLWERTAYGSLDFEVPGGERRLYLEDGDEVIFQAQAKRDGFVPIGFGECRGRLEPAKS
jgi:fumarylacetoacetase